MNQLAQSFAEQLLRTLAQLPATIARKAPSWLASHTLSYLKWLWRTELMSKVLMLALTIVAVEVVLARLPGPHALFEQLGGLLAIGLGFFLIASLLFGGGRRS